MSAFISTCWPIILLAYAFILLFIVRVFQLSAEFDDDRRDEVADTERQVSLAEFSIPLHDRSNSL